MISSIEYEAFAVGDSFANSHGRLSTICDWISRDGDMWDILRHRAYDFVGFQLRDNSPY